MYVNIYVYAYTHTYAGHLLLSLHAPDVLHAIDPDMQQQRPSEFARNLDILNAKLSDLKAAIAQNPVRCVCVKVCVGGRGAGGLLGVAKEQWVLLCIFIEGVAVCFVVCDAVWLCGAV